MTNISAIRSVFLFPRSDYSVSDLASLLATSEEDIRAWIEIGELEASAPRDGLEVPWSEVVSFGMDFWSQEVVEEALGADAIHVIPALLRLTELVVQIPKIHVITLERLAAIDGETISAVLARELRDLVSVHAPWLSSKCPDSPKRWRGRKTSTLSHRVAADHRKGHHIPVRSRAPAWIVTLTSNPCVIPRARAVRWRASTRLPVMTLQPASWCGTIPPLRRAGVAQLVE